MTHQPDLITIAGAARRAGVSEATIRRWIREGKLLKYKDTRRSWVDGIAVDRLITPAPVVTGVGA